MRYILLAVAAVMATGCGQGGCKKCVDPDMQNACEDAVSFCNLLGPAALALNPDCKKDAYAVCENWEDTSQDTDFAQ